MRNLPASAALLLALVHLAPASRAGAGEDQPVPEPPPLPTITRLRLEPDRLTLLHARDGRKVLVLGETSTGGVVDLGDQARMEPGSDAVAVEADGYLTGRRTGEVTVRVTAAGHEALLPVTVADMTTLPVGFVRDIEPILARAGCNQGTCHGSAKGKNGFKLSLRGYDPQFDYESLVNDLSGRRFNRVDVDGSLLLQKPLGQVPHEGHQVIVPGSRYHGLLRQWIAEGARDQTVEGHRPEAITVLPAEVELDLPGRRQRFVVLASYPDGTTRDVTREAVLSSNNGEVALVRDDTLTALRRGEASVLVRYEGLYAAREVVVMGDRSGFEFAPQPEHNFIDTHVNARLRRMRINPSEACSDSEFIRRVSLDLTGLPPTPDRVRAFLADPADSAARRAALVDELLDSPAYAVHWANKYADLLQCNSENLGKKGVWVFRNWIERQFRENRPYDAFARELLLARGSTFENPAANYLRALRDPDKMTEDVSQTFLGIRFNCNKCHDHPFELWTQDQYYEFVAFFARVAFKRGTLGRDVLIRPGETYASEQVSEEIVYTSHSGGEVLHPRHGRAVAPRVPFGDAPMADPDADRRPALVDWLTAPDNPYFARSAVNRFWSYFFGRGIIDPVDDIRAGNPPSNPALLDALTSEFVGHGFDVRWLLRTICTSRTYQAGIVPNRWNADDTVNFSRALPRRLSAEQLLDAVAVATGHSPRFGELPAGLRAAELADGRVAGSDFLALFGRPKRQSACECERSSNVTLAHALNLINGPTLGDAIASPDNRFARLVRDQPDDARVIEEVYLACLCRLPTDAERDAIRLEPGADRLASVQDLAWALLNSPAFLFNR